MTITQLITSVLEQSKIQNVIYSPGSRNAALTLAFSRNPFFKLFQVSDERCAGYFALGNSLNTQKPTVLVCTSGTAATNLSSAISEAYFQNVPLLVLTADRPIEWIGQQDSQAIFQSNLYQNHVQKSYQLPILDTHPDTFWHAKRIINESLHLLLTQKKPVHINVPFREPFYPKTTEKTEEKIKNTTFFFISSIQAQKSLPAYEWEKLLTIWQESPKKLLALGQMYPSKKTLNSIQFLYNECQIPVICDVIANSISVSQSHDFTLLNPTELQSPDLLITAGDAFLSKPLKNYLRKKGGYHWHISEKLELIDTFQNTTHRISIDLEYFLENLIEITENKNRFSLDNDSNDQEEFFEEWLKLDQKAKVILHNKIHSFLEFTEILGVAKLMEFLPKNTHLHLGNSLSVRYVNFLSQNLCLNDIIVHSNRGTSGIDGCLSTAIGAALYSKQLHTCILGDMSFQYDQNALWIESIPKNLRVVILNNFGGGIFRILEEAAQQPELETHFVTSQQHTFKTFSEEKKLEYFTIRSFEELENFNFDLFFSLSSSSAKVLEIITDGKSNARLFQEIKKSF